MWISYLLAPSVLSALTASLAEPTLFVHNWGYSTCVAQVVIEPKLLWYDVQCVQELRAVIHAVQCCFAVRPTACSKGDTLDSQSW